MNEDSLHLGDPTARAFSKADTAAKDQHETSSHTQSIPESSRAGDSGLGTPSPKAETEKIRILSEIEQTLLHKSADDELEDRFNQRLQAINSSSLRIPPFVYRSGLWILLLLSGILGLFIVSEIATLYRNIIELPIYLQYIIGAAAIVFSLLIITVIGKLSLQLFALKRSPQINLKALSILAERAELRLLVAEKTQEAREALKDYLAQYPLDNHPHLYSLGINSQTIKELTAVRDNLLAGTHPLSATEWISEFTDRFQQPLENIARQRIKRYASKVAFGTAAAPIGVIDQLIVLYGSLAMIKDILAIYNLRPAFAQSAVVLSRAIMQAYLSGLIGSASESGVETMSDAYEEWTGELFAGSLSGSLKSLFAKTAEAGLNGFLLWRLGKATVAHVQMIDKKK